MIEGRGESTLCCHKSVIGVHGSPGALRHRHNRRSHTEQVVMTVDVGLDSADVFTRAVESERDSFAQCTDSQKSLLICDIVGKGPGSMGLCIERYDPLTDD
jgi:hypothetical protein